MCSEPPGISGCFCHLLYAFVLTLALILFLTTPNILVGYLAWLKSDFLCPSSLWPNMVAAMSRTAFSFNPGQQQEKILSSYWSA